MKRLLKSNFIMLLFFASSLAILIISIFSRTMMIDSAAMIEETSKQQMVALSRAAALLASAEELDEYVGPEDMEKAEYAELNQKLVKFTKDSGIAYTYFLRLDTETDMMQFIIDNSEGEFLALAQPQVEREDTPNMALSGTAVAAELGSYSEGWEGYISAFAPVYYSDGRPSNTIAGVDMLDVYIKRARNNISMLSMVLVISMAVVLGTCFICLLLYRKKAKQAEDASLTKSSFLSNMSHEMRTPMNAIIGMTKIADGSNDFEKMKHCLAAISSSSEHLLRLINDILDMSKIEAGKFELDSEYFDIEKMLIKISNLIVDKTEQKRQILNITLGKNMHLNYKGDELRLSQVITNLLSNAVKFTPEEGKITLHVDETQSIGDDTILQFSVSDTGIGMTQEQIGRLFNLFEQADGTISRKYGGTGLGLAISKNIIEKMGGGIWVESEIEKGSTFRFTVKLECSAAHKSELVFDGVTTPGRKLLFVDDSEDAREQFLEITNNFEIYSDEAKSGERAISLIEKAYAKNEPYDAVFLSFSMPDMDGVEIVKRLDGKINKDTVIIMMPFSESNQFEDCAKGVGIHRFMTKILFPSVILGLIHNVAGNTETLQDADTSSQQEDFSNISLLLVEDVEINREIFISLLEDTKIEIDVAENGLLAVQQFKAHPDKYDMIIMDVQMPEMDGYEATGIIRSLDIQNAQTIPIIAMTANVFKEDIEKCIASGMDDHIAKPIDVEKVIEKIAQYSKKQTR